MQGISEIQKDLSSYTLKNLAIFAMFFDHIFAVFVPQDSLEGVALRIAGRIAAPIMCYMIAEGYHYTSNLKKYIVRLALFAAVSHFPYVWYFGLPWWQATSVIWGLALGLVALAAAKREDWSHPLKVFIVLICCLLAVPADWNYVAVLWILFFGLFRGQIEKQLLSFCNHRDSVPHHPFNQRNRLDAILPNRHFSGDAAAAILQRPSRQEIQPDEMGLLCFLSVPSVAVGARENDCIRLMED